MSNPILENYSSAKRLIGQLNSCLHSGICSAMPHETVATSSRPSVKRYREEIERIIKDIETNINRIMWVIDHMANERERDILIRRYINGQDWFHIAEDMMYSLSQTYKIHTKAVASFETIWNRKRYSFDLVKHLEGNGDQP